MIMRALKFLLGYVEFSVRGDFPERLLNQLAANRIPFWDIGRRENVLTMKILVKDYKKLRKVKGKNRVRTRCLSRHGLPFILKKYRRRSGLVVGAALYFLLLFYLSSFVWNINVEGNERLSTEEILTVCEELGLYEGVSRKSIDQEELKTRLALELPDIAWASVNIEGSVVTVNISESIVSEESDRSPCNLVASRDGIIERTEVTEGNVQIKTGQTVKSGELLVSGITEYKDGSFSIGRSSGKVFARTSRNLQYLATFVQTEQIYVGKPIKRSVLTVFGVDIPLYFGSLRGEFEKHTTEHRIEYKDAYLPVKLTTAVFYRVDRKAFQIDEAQAREIAAAKLGELEKAELEGAEILSKNVTFEVTEKGVLITGEYTCSENIAERDLLLIYREK